MSSEALVCKKFWVNGRVQGVYFRASAREVARRLGVRGWIGNTADGRVEVLAQGTLAAMLEFEQWLTRGPERARVTAVLSEISAEDAGTGFEVR